MKRYILYIILVFTVFQLKAQVPSFTVTPGELDALTENVKITFDVTGTAVEGETDVYIWAWSSQIGSPSEMLLCYEGASASWGNISPNAKLKPIDGQANMFELTLPMTVTRNGEEVTFKTVADLFGVTATPGKIKSFGFLLRNIDGSKQTDGDGASEVTLKPLIFEASEFRTFPSSVSVNDVVTVYFDKNQSTNDQLKLMKNVKVNIAFLDADNIILVETTEAIETSEEGNGEYAFSFLADKLLTFPDGLSIADLVKCRVSFSGVLAGSGDTEIEVQSSDFTFNFADYE